MTIAARMQCALERGALDDDGDGGEACMACMAAIDDGMRVAEREESWPRFIDVLRARGPELREHMLRLVELSSHPRQRGARPRRRPLRARLADVGLGEELRDLLDHAQRVMAHARSIWYLLEERDPDDVLTFPQVREHVLEGENAAWMHTFALLLLARVASGTTALEQPSTELAITLAVEAARDAGAHWATALELLAEVETEPNPPEERSMQLQ